MEAAYDKWYRRYDHSLAGFFTVISELRRELHTKHLEEFRRELTAHGAPQRIMMLRQMNAELEYELRKRDAREEMLRWREANVWANALPGVAPDGISLAEAMRRAVAMTASVPTRHAATDGV